jgi:hypothetical protein
MERWLSRTILSGPMFRGSGWSNARPASAGECLKRLEQYLWIMSQTLQKSAGSADFEDGAQSNI